MTRNNKVVLGVAAGVAALAVAGLYAKKKGYLDNINTSSLKEKLGGLKDTAMKAFNGQSDNSTSTQDATNGAAKRKSTSGMNTGNVGNINPATT